MAASSPVSSRSRTSRDRPMEPERARAASAMPASGGTTSRSLSSGLKPSLEKISYATGEGVGLRMVQSRSFKIAVTSDRLACRYSFRTIHDERLQTRSMRPASGRKLKIVAQNPTAFPSAYSAKPRWELFDHGYVKSIQRQSSLDMSFVGNRRSNGWMSSNASTPTGRTSIDMDHLCSSKLRSCGPSSVISQAATHQRSERAARFVAALEPRNHTLLVGERTVLADLPFALEVLERDLEARDRA